MIVLSHKQITSLNITFNECLNAIVDVLKEHAKKRVFMPSKVSITPEEGIFFTSMPSYVPKYNMSGIKWVSRFPKNSNKNIPKVISTYLLNDMITGHPLAVMEASWLTAMRTGAMAGLTAKYFAIQEAKTLSIIGAGVQSVACLQFIKLLCPQIKKIKIYRYKNTTIRFIKRFKSSKLIFEICSSIKKTIENSDIILTATTYADKPFINPEWLKPGILALPIHHRGWEKCAMKFDKTITDDKKQTLYYKSKGEFSGGLPTIYAELGEIILGKIARSNNREKIIAYNIGIAICDIALAKIIYEKAVKKGIKNQLFNDYKIGFYL